MARCAGPPVERLDRDTETRGIVERLRRDRPGEHRRRYRDTGHEEEAVHHGSSTGGPIVSTRVSTGSPALPGPSNDAKAIEKGSKTERRASVFGAGFPSSSTPRSRSRANDVKGISIGWPGAERLRRDRAAQIALYQRGAEG